ncbi:Uncharacterized protein Fot_29530 [Forsythia ovata]|uniref:Bulb-type lectin domain-containing protein n=1 Tax=Forsythia ovata TaxID=205694 RepID=A0ABD1TS51_9LAMI
MSDVHIGYQLTLAIPSAYTEGFSGRAFLMETEQISPNFRTALSVEAINENYLCSLDIFLGDVKVWSSSPLSQFYTREKCVLELTQYGDLRLKDQNERIGWRSGTSGQVGTNIGDIAVWEGASRERLAFRNFKVWDLGACTMTLQASLANEYTASVNRVMWSPGGTLFGMYC